MLKEWKSELVHICYEEGNKVAMLYQNGKIEIYTLKPAILVLKNKYMEKIITFQVDGVDAGSGTMFIVDGKVSTEDVEETFYKVLRRESKDPIDQELGHIIENLTKEQEDKLQEAHAKDYHGTDDDMPDNYEYWMSNLDLAEIKEILFTKKLEVKHE